MLKGQIELQDSGQGSYRSLLRLDEAGLVRMEVHPPGQAIVRQGETGDKFYLIRRGTVRVLVDDGRGPRCVKELGRADFFGDRALLTDEPRNASVIAVDRDLRHRPGDVPALSPGQHTLQPAGAGGLRSAVPGPIRAAVTRPCHAS